MKLLYASIECIDMGIYSKFNGYLCWYVLMQPEKTLTLLKVIELQQ